MACDTKLEPGQTITERKQEVKEAVEALARGLANGSIKAVVSKEGAIAFAGFLDSERRRVTDGCAYRRLLVSGSGLAKAAVARAEASAGRSVSKQVVGQGLHSHDGGKTWHGH